MKQCNKEKLPHIITKDIKAVLDANQDVAALWDTLTSLARNEWICWITIVKKKETRKEHLTRLCEDLKRGKWRPCCWSGCPHRKVIAQNGSVE